MSSIRTSELARLLGVTSQTIRKYVRQNKIPHHLSPSGQLFFTKEDVDAIIGDKDLPTDAKRVWAHYARSSSGNKSIINSQFEKLEEAYGKPDFKIQDSASGMNENRKGLNQLLDLVFENKVTDIAVVRQDRLARFGLKYLNRVFSKYGVRVHELAQVDEKSLQDEMMDDFMTIIASFSGRFSQMKSRQAKLALLEKAKNRVDAE